MAAGLAAHVRASDVVARLGGDEFAVLMWNLDAAQAAAKARELENIIAQIGVPYGTARLSVGASAGIVPLKADSNPAEIIDAADKAMYARKKERRAFNLLRGNPGMTIVLRNNIRRELVVDPADLVAQHELALLQALHLDQVGAGRGGQGRDRRIEIAMLLLQARQLLTQRAFFLVGHCHRWFALRPVAGLGRKRNNYRVFHKRIQAGGKVSANQRLWLHLLRRGGGCTVALALSLS